jgi:hypothetical protein
MLNIKERPSNGSCLVVDVTSRFHSFTEGVGGFHRDTTAATAFPSMVTTMLKGVAMQSWQSRGGGV